MEQSRSPQNKKKSLELAIAWHSQSLSSLSCSSFLTSILYCAPPSSSRTGGRFRDRMRRRGPWKEAGRVLGLDLTASGGSRSRRGRPSTQARAVARDGARQKWACPGLKGRGDHGLALRASGGSRPRRRHSSAQTHAVTRGRGPVLGGVAIAKKGRGELGLNLRASGGSRSRLRRPSTQVRAVARGGARAKWARPCRKGRGELGVNLSRRRRSSAQARAMARGRGPG